MDDAAIEAEPARRPDGLVTLVEGSSFCVSGRSGDISPGHPQGLFFRDTRIVSQWELQVDAGTPEVLTVVPHEPYRATFVARIPPVGVQTEVLVERRRFIGDGMREDLVVRNLGSAPVTAVLRLCVGADFADLFDVKESRVRPNPGVTVTPSGGVFRAEVADGAGRRGVSVAADGARARHDGLEFAVRVGPRDRWSTSVVVQPSVDGHEIASNFPPDRPWEESPPARRFSAWRSGSPVVRTPDSALGATLRRSMEDLGALRITDPQHPESVAVAAGAPWFMALFGRDSLLASYLALPLDPTLALGTVQALARAQGTKVDPRTEEQPGRILHETRLGRDFPLSHGGGSVYYGTVDATPLFVMVLGELRRWGIGDERVDALLPNLERALEWIDGYGDRDGDGFVEYERTTPSGLANQGWKDSFDGVTFADGRIAEPPIALCEVQGYTYAAFVARAHFAREAGDAGGERYWAARAAALKRAFNERFWLPDRGWFALALDRDKRPVDALASNMGHCLWTGIVDVDKAGAVASRLMSPEMFSGWGVRTLATTMGAYNPMSYHNGSIWPHDNALVAAGLMRYGFVAEAQRVATAVLDAAAALGHTLPELYCGFPREEYDPPLPYPAACAPQAWAAATPVQLMRTLLRLDPQVPEGVVHFAPAWPAKYGPLAVRNLRIGGHSTSLTVGVGGARLTGLEPDAVVVPEPRAPLTRLDARDPLNPQGAGGADPGAARP
jgi:glycogen debranching enzyme